MSTVGHFEIVKEVARTAVVQGYLVKTEQKPDGSLFLKRCAPRGEGIDPRPFIRSFVDAAAVQEAVGARPGAYWAPVIERGEDGDGAYYVTNLYPGSAQKLVAGKFRLSGPALHTLVRAVLAGLVELKQACARHHGNLKPTNVLIARTDDVEDRDVLLTDPADSARPEANDGGADDLFQLGQLIHQLVLHKTFRPVTGWPVEPSEEWSRLGYAGNRWREFCNHLLHPDALARPADLDEALKEVERVSRRPLAFTLVRYAAVAAVLAALAGGAWYYVQHRAVSAEVDALKGEWNGWYREFLDFDAFKTEVRNDPALDAALAPALAAAQESTRSLAVTGDLINTRPGVFDRSRREKVRQALASIRRLQEGLRGWEFRQSLAAREQEVRKREWSAVADYLRKRLSESEPAAGNSVGLRMRDLLRDKDRIKAALAECEQAWAAIRANCLRIAGWEKSPFLGQFVAQALYAGRDRAVFDVTSLEEFRDDLKQWQDKTRTLADRIRADWQKEVSLEHVLSAEKSLTPDQYEDWLKLLEQYRLQTIEAGALRALRQALADTARTLDDLGASARDDTEQDRVQKLKSGRAALDETLRQVADSRFAGSEAVHRKLKELDQQVKTYLDQVDTELSRGRETAKAWSVAAVAKFDDAEPIIREGWREHFGALAGPDPASLTGVAYVDARRKADESAAALRKVGLTFPQPADAADEAFGTALKEGWEKALRRAVGVWAESEGADRDNRLAEVQQAYDAWLRGTRSLADGYRAARGLLDSGASLDAASADGLTLEQLADALRKEVPESPALQAAIAGVVREVDRLKEVEAQVADLRAQVDQRIKRDELLKARDLCNQILALKAGDRDARQRLDDIAGRIAQRTAEMLGQAQKLLQEERFEAAEVVLNDAVTLSPAHPDVAPLRGRISEAREQAKRSEVGLAVQKAGAQLERGRPDEALNELGAVKSDETAARAAEIRRLIAAAPAAARQADQWFEEGKYLEALRSYHEALRGGNAHAMYRAAFIYRQRLAGRSAPDEYVAELVGAAAQRKDPEALHEAAVAGDAGALKGLQELAGEGDAAAQSLYGQMLQDGTGGVTQSLARAARQYLNATGREPANSASRRQVAEAMYRLARMYESGEGLPRSQDRAELCYKKASQMRHAKARERLEQIAVANRPQPSRQPRTPPRTTNRGDLDRILREQ